MITIPLDLLPSDDVERSQILHDYFLGQEITCELSGRNWVITNSYPESADYYVDPDLLKGLKWWGDNIQISDIPFAVKQKSFCQLSLNDSWTLFAWSKWLSSFYKAYRRLPSEVVILHVDDHDDLMTPYVSKKLSGWSDLITKKDVDLLNPTSISSSIRSSAIGIGSFITPLIHTISKVHIRHLCATEYSVTRKGLYLLEPTYKNDTLLSPNSKRISLNLTKDVEGIDADKLKTYEVTSDTRKWLDNLPDNVPVFLHIDMDYFNNRFNGDSDWEENNKIHNPSVVDVNLSIIGLFERLLESRLNVDDIAIALSPGFFPAELWESSIDLTLEYIEKLRDNSQKKF